MSPSDSKALIEAMGKLNDTLTVVIEAVAHLKERVDELEVVVYDEELEQFPALVVSDSGEN